ncbi:CHAT domain-containing protein [Pseudonocardia charpentierae]|uniref:CHAT domain-containing protein n=1 Tax=Pseudonocardia charpentierae TaxID=3075545 RepID=A0ABU2N3Q8_9PSEU|nr:CHAT domain-containing protein [Pseudonocardia sp. DSM 45834]MDT0348148.1 CHAT domain-containing protein [Pseudonocardia sp. DSM 45834]
MNEFELEVFEQTSDYVELRLRGSGSRVQTRGLDRVAVEELIGVAEQSYAQDAVAQGVFGAAGLRELGERLFAFLDGDQRWLAAVVDDPSGAVLRFSAEQRLRHLPWELLTRGGDYLAVSGQAPLLAIRAARAGAGQGGPSVAGNRPLRVLFMATSPEGVEPVLNYEAEEAGILAVTADTGTELVVEESGTLEGLRFTAESYGAGYFDVLHISGHADVREGRPVFLVENELGAPVWAEADEFVQAMAGQWPRMVFVSGCLTANAPGQGKVPSMSESLVRAGAPIVLGWALPVGDIAASSFAAELYRGLAAGLPVHRSVVVARQRLYRERSRNWHLLRVYADSSPLTPMVTARNTPRRERIRVRQAAAEFLDPQTRISRVAPREAFVGRRRVIQRCLRTLTQPLGTAGAAEALVVQGMGGLGKSTLASRLLERMPTYQRVVWFGRVDLTKLRELTEKVTFADLDQQIEATELLNNERADLTVRLRYLFAGPLADIPCLLVLDDFEHNLDERDSGHVLSPAMAQILPALLTAIRDTNSPSRVLITSRYRFPEPDGSTVRVEALETLTDVEQTKKIANLTNLRPASLTTPPEVKDRAVHAASGNPRLLDWLDKIVADPDLDVEGLIAAIEGEADRFRRENIFAEKLLATQPLELRTMLARLNVVELPVPAATVYAVHDHPDATAHVHRAAALGLLEEGTDADTGQPRYFVSNVLRPLIRPLLTDDQYRDACAAAARSLYDLWVTTPGTASPDLDSN